MVHFVLRTPTFRPFEPLRIEGNCDPRAAARECTPLAVPLASRTLRIRLGSSRLRASTSRTVDQLAVVHLAAVPDRHDDDQQDVVGKGVDDAIVIHADAKP